MIVGGLTKNWSVWESANGAKGTATLDKIKNASQSQISHFNSFYMCFHEKIMAFSKAEWKELRIGRSPQSDSFQRSIDQFQSENNTLWRDVHFMPDTHLVTKDWWALYHLLERIFNSSTLASVEKYRQEFFRKWAANSDNRQVATLKKEREAILNATGLDLDSTWSDNFPIIFTNYTPVSFGNESKYAIYNRGDRTAKMKIFEGCVACCFLVWS